MYHMVHKFRVTLGYSLSHLYTLARSPIIKDFCIYSGGSLLLRGSSLLVAPITLSVLSPAQFGLYALANSFIAIASVLIGLGLRQYLSLEFFHASSMQRREIVNDMIVVYLAIATPCCLCMALAAFLHADALVSADASDSSAYGLIVLSIVSCFISFFVELFYQILRYQCKALLLTIVQVSAACVVVISSLILLWAQCGVCGLLFSSMLGMLYGIGIAAWEYYARDCWRSFDWRRGTQKIGYYVARGAPFIPTVLFGWILASSSRWVLARYGSLSDVGIYSLADSVGQLYTLFILYPMSGSYLPHLLMRYAANQHDLGLVERWNMRVMWMSMIAMTCIITIGYGVCNSCVRSLLPVQYHDAASALWFILMANVFLMGTYFATALIQFRKKTSILLVSIGVSATCNLILTLLLVPSFGIRGCLWASLASYVIYFAIILFCNWRLRLYFNQFRDAS